MSDLHTLECVTSRKSGMWVGEHFCLHKNLPLFFPGMTCFCLQQSLWKVKKGIHVSWKKKSLEELHFPFALLSKLSQFLSNVWMIYFYLFFLNSKFSYLTFTNWCLYNPQAWNQFVIYNRPSPVSNSSRRYPSASRRTWVCVIAVSVLTLCCGGVSIAGLW